MPAEVLLRKLDGRTTGLSAQEAAERLARHGPNAFERDRGHSGLMLFLAQLRSPLVLILAFAAIVSGIAGDLSDAVIILAIVFGSALLSFVQEYRASAALDALRQRVSTRAMVLRDGVAGEVPATDLVPGDVVALRAGDLVPADCIVLEAKDFYVVQAGLTGESFPVQKTAVPSAATAVLAERENMLFMGTSVRSGTASAIVAVTGGRTEFGAIAGALERQESETAFVIGTRRFGYLMSEAMLSIVIVVLVANVAMDRPLLESLMFSVALAVGLTPQMLPAIISVTLSRGARRMAEAGVIVKRLASIENIGSMDVLCTDKTGTISVGSVRLSDAVDVDGRSSAEVLARAWLNSHFQTGLANPLDEAVVAASDRMPTLPAGIRKVDEIPYDFARKRLSIVVEPETGEGQRSLIVKGAYENVLAVCTSYLRGGERKPLDEAAAAGFRARYEAWGGEGFRVLALAEGAVPSKDSYETEDERDLALVGFLLFSDPAKADARTVLGDLKRRGIATKIITGDNRFVAAHLAGEVGLDVRRVLTGDDIASLSHEALVHQASRIDLFAEIDPNQKERIVNALRAAGHVVGYMGDGINDATALQSADIGISVDQAVDVAKEAADMVLMEQNLDVVCRGVDEGRRIFANTMKYVAITTSANFGNMISMAAASLFLPFLPLLAKQILLNNFLSDIPALAIADDNVDADMIARPHHWDIGYIRRFMITFGLISSIFDLLTFAVLLGVFHAGEEVFRTGWFIESLVTELCILLVIRTPAPFLRSVPGRLLLAASVLVTVLAVAIPYLPYADDLGFTPLPLAVMAALAGITLAYLWVSEVTKHRFFAAEARRSTQRPRRRPRHRTVRNAGG